MRRLTIATDGSGSATNLESRATDDASLAFMNAFAVQLDGSFRMERAERGKRAVPCLLAPQLENCGPPGVGAGAWVLNSLQGVRLGGRRKILQRTGTRAEVRHANSLRGSDFGRTRLREPALQRLAFGARQVGNA